MTQNISLLTLSVIATAAALAERFIDRATGTYPTAGGPAFGVTRSDGAIGDRVPCDILGTAVVTAGGEIAEGEFIEVGTAGKAVAYDDGVVVAQALQPAAEEGDRIEVLLIQGVPLQDVGGGGP